MENYNKTDCLALTIRKEHRLVVINKAVKKTITISVKTILAAICLTLLNVLFNASGFWGRSSNPDFLKGFRDVVQIPAISILIKNSYTYKKAPLSYKKHFFLIFTSIYNYLLVCYNNI